MKTTDKKSVSKTSSCDAEAENLQSLSDSENDDELFEDCLSENPADSNPNSDDSYYSLPDTENTATDLNLPTVSGDGASTGHAIDTEPENPVNALALSPSHSSSDGVISATARPVLETLINSSRNMNVVILVNITHNAVEGAEILNTGTGRVNTSTAIEMVDFSGEQSPKSPDDAYKTLDASTDCESSGSGNVSPHFQKTNDALGLQGITDTISHTSVINETCDSILKENKSGISPQKINNSFKSPEKNKLVSKNGENVSPSKLALKNALQRTENDDSSTFTSRLNEGASISGYSSSNNVFQTCTKKEVKTVHDTHNPFSSQSFSVNSPEHPDFNSLCQISPDHPDLNNSLHQTFHGQSVLNDAIPQTSDDCSVLNDVIPHTSTNHLVSNSGIPHTSVDLIIESNAVSHSSTDHRVSDSIISNSSNILVLNPSNYHTFRGYSVLNNSIAYTYPENQVLNNVPSYTFSNHSVLNNPQPHTFPARPVLNIAIYHTFPGHPNISYYITTNSFECPVVNITLSDHFSQAQMLNITQSYQGLVDPLSSIVHSSPELTHRPLLHISLYYNPQHIVLFGFSHNFSGNSVLNITLSDSFSQHPFFYFIRIFPPDTYPGQPALLNAIPHHFRAYPVLNSVPPQNENPNCDAFGNSFTEPPPRFCTYSTQPVVSNQPIIHQFPSTSNTYQPFTYTNYNFTNALCTSIRQRYPSQLFSNMRLFPAPAFSNQPPYLYPRVPLFRGYPIHSFPTQYRYLQFPQQAYNPPQAEYHWARHMQIETDSDSDQEVHTDSDQEEYTDTDQGIYTDTDQGEHSDADQAAHEDQ